jgi:hypothetical protein
MLPTENVRCKQNINKDTLKFNDSLPSREAGTVSLSTQCCAQRQSCKKDSYKIFEKQLISTKFRQCLLKNKHIINPP